MTHRPPCQPLSLFQVSEVALDSTDPRETRAPQRTTHHALRTTHRAPRRVEPDSVSARDRPSHETGHVQPHRRSMFNKLLQRVTGQLAGANADADADADADVRCRFPCPRCDKRQAARPPHPSCLPLLCLLFTALLSPALSLSCATQLHARRHRRRLPHANVHAHAPARRRCASSYPDPPPYYSALDLALDRRLHFRALALLALLPPPCAAPSLRRRALPTRPAAARPPAPRRETRRTAVSQRFCPQPPALPELRWGTWDKRNAALMSEQSNVTGGKSARPKTGVRTLYQH